jgi:signal transduction histidine kinase
MTGRGDLRKRGGARGSRRSPSKKPRVSAAAAPRKGLAGAKARKRVFANKRIFASKTAKPVRRRAAKPSSGVAALAVLAHETRTALNGILAWSELLAATVLEDRQRGWASGLKQTAEHLSALTSIIVDAAQVESGTLTLREDTFRPRALFDEIAASLAARTEIKGLATGAVVEGDLPDFVVGDPVRIRAALDNLMDNAV